MRRFGGTFFAEKWGVTRPFVAIKTEELLALFARVSRGAIYLATTPAASDRLLGADNRPRLIGDCPDTVAPFGIGGVRAEISIQVVNQDCYGEQALAHLIHVVTLG